MYLFFKHYKVTNFVFNPNESKNPQNPLKKPGQNLPHDSPRDFPKIFSQFLVRWNQSSRVKGGCGRIPEVETWACRWHVAAAAARPQLGSPEIQRRRLVIPCGDALLAFPKRPASSPPPPPSIPLSSLFAPLPRYNFVPVLLPPKSRANVRSFPKIWRHHSGVETCVRDSIRL